MMDDDGDETNEKEFRMILWFVCGVHKLSATVGTRCKRQEWWRAPNHTTSCTSPS